MIIRTDPVIPSFDNTQHNGGIYKVFEREGGNLKRIGTADKDLRIFKK